MCLCIGTGKNDYLWNGKRYSRVIEAYLGDKETGLNVLDAKLLKLEE
jgi:hypothetical protein